VTSYMSFQCAYLTAAFFSHMWTDDLHQEVETFLNHSEHWPLLSGVLYDSSSWTTAVLMLQSLWLTNQLLTHLARRERHRAAADNEAILPHAVNCWRFCFWCCQSVDFFVGTDEWICSKFTRKTCLVPRSDEFEGQCQRSSSPGTTNGIFGFRRPPCGLSLVKTSLSSCFLCFLRLNQSINRILYLAALRLDKMTMTYK